MLAIIVVICACQAPNHDVNDISDRPTVETSELPEQKEWPFVDEYTIFTQKDCATDSDCKFRYQTFCSNTPPNKTGELPSQSDVIFQPTGKCLDRICEFKRSTCTDRDAKTLDTCSTKAVAVYPEKIMGYCSHTPIVSGTGEECWCHLEPLDSWVFECVSLKIVDRDVRYEARTIKRCGNACDNFGCR